jgi:mono/diheme cytochrome c family protein
MKLLIGMIALFPVLALAQTPRTQDQQVTFNRDIAPIVFHNCSTCHRPGESGPFSLLTYSDVKRHAIQIVHVTGTHFMPPWLPEPGEHKFADERRLSPEEIATIAKWVEQGTPQGDPRDLPSQPQFTAGWQLGPPDVVLKAIKPYLLAASGGDQYWNFVLPAGVDKTRWVKAVEIRPADKRLVHHANLLIDSAQDARHMEVEKGAGFGGMEISFQSKTFDPDSHFLFWKPGSAPYVEPRGMAWRLDPGTDLVLNVHLQPSGKPEEIQPSVGLYFTDQPATQHPMLLQIQNDRALDIPAGDANFVVSSDFTLPVEVDLLAIYPHAHYLGKDLLATATLPDGTRTTLIHIPNWNLKWQGVFRYATPVRLPKGTTIAMRYVYDNSEENIANPSTPPKRVTAGNAATDEMAHLWLQVLPKNTDPSEGDPRRVLMEALSRRTLQNDPSDFAAHYNLAAMLQARGELEQALQEYRAAVRSRPENPVAENGLGAVLMAMDRAAEAIPFFRKATDERSDYFDAHYNLALALHATGDLAASIEQLRDSVALAPDDASAHANLGAALAEAGRLPEAEAQLQKALEIDPHHELARENLALIKQGQK